MAACHVGQSQNPMSLCKLATSVPLDSDSVFSIILLLILRIVHNVFDHIYPPSPQLLPDPPPTPYLPNFLFFSFSLLCFKPSKTPLFSCTLPFPVFFALVTLSFKRCHCAPKHWGSGIEHRAHHNLNNTRYRQMWQMLRGLNMGEAEMLGPLNLGLTTRPAWVVMK